jgi:LPS export ABC transporter permease LptG/LPS export ABC transporter permease LptF
MPKIDKLLCQAIIPPFLISLAVLTFVVFINEISSVSELLITRNASLGVILIVGGAILPRILIFSLPLAYLIGILIGLSGLSGESQITALRACGIPVRMLLRPILVLGLAVGSATAVLSTAVLPRTNDILQLAKQRMSLTRAFSYIQPRVFNEDFPNIVFYLEDLSVDRQHGSGVFLSDNSDSKSPRTIMARSGTWIVDSENKRFQLHLEQGASYTINPEDPSNDNVSVFKKTDIPIDLQNEIADPGDQNPRPRKVTEQYTTYLWKHYQQVEQKERLEFLIELNRRFALPFSVFPFALLGLTLAVRAKKGGRTSGFVLSLIAVLLFYILFINGIRLASVGKVNPWIGAWGANAIMAAVGLILLARVEKGFGISPYIDAFWTYSRNQELSNRLPLQGLRKQFAAIDNSIIRSTSGLARFLFIPKIFDLYISRGFFIYFFWSLLTCGTLFVLLTLFDLLDDIIRNRIPVSYVLDYFTFLTPQILMLVIPMSVLLAILINFGILEKNSEITAMKAGGWSLYRVGIPVFLIASGFCMLLFFNQDYVLPYANERQDSLRNVIKGRPPQTTTRLQRKWILGDSDRIYNYEYFDGNQDSFVDLNVYDIDFKSVRILRRIHAARAHIDQNGLWTLQDGYIRDYHPQGSGFRHIESEVFRFPEKAGYFEKEIFQPKESSKLTYLELTNYISYLHKSGYNATELQVELNKKISFPLSCMIMALLAVPFSFSTGKKGAFWGIGVSIAIAITYWGISGIFEAMGTYGLLIPILAAWAPNILFGAAGLTLFLTVRT